MHKNKSKGTRFEYDIKHALQMVGFEVFRAWSSIGTADLSAHPPWNPRGNYRGLLIQAKNQQSGDYLRPEEKSHIDYLQQINSAMVCIFYKKGKKCMIKVWESGKVFEFDDFMREIYGIPCKYSELITRFKIWQRPLHLYPVEKEIYTTRTGKTREKPVAPFTDIYAHDVWFPHVPEKYRDRHILEK